MFVLGSFAIALPIISDFSKSAPIVEYPNLISKSIFGLSSKSNKPPNENPLPLPSLNVGEQQGTPGKLLKEAE